MELQHIDTQSSQSDSVDSVVVATPDGLHLHGGGLYVTMFAQACGEVKRRLGQPSVIWQRQELRHKDVLGHCSSLQLPPLRLAAENAAGQEAAQQELALVLLLGQSVQAWRAVLEWLESAAPFTFTLQLTRGDSWYSSSTPQVLEECAEAENVVSCSWAQWADLLLSMESARQDSPVLWMDLRTVQSLELGPRPLQRLLWLLRLADLAVPLMSDTIYHDTFSTKSFFECRDNSSHPSCLEPGSCAGAKHFWQSDHILCAKVCESPHSMLRLS